MLLYECVIVEMQAQQWPGSAEQDESRSVTRAGSGEDRSARPKTYRRADRRVRAESRSHGKLGSY